MKLQQLINENKDSPSSKRRQQQTDDVHVTVRVLRGASGEKRTWRGSSWNVAGRRSGGGRNTGTAGDGRRAWNIRGGRMTGTTKHRGFFGQRRFAGSCGGNNSRRLGATHHPLLWRFAGSCGSRSLGALHPLLLHWPRSWRSFRRRRRRSAHTAVIDRITFFIILRW